MRVVEEQPRKKGEKPNRFGGESGTITSPGEPPTRADAADLVFQRYLEDDDAPEPDGPTITAALEHLQQLHAQGAWERP